MDSAQQGEALDIHFEIREEIVSESLLLVLVEVKPINEVIGGTS